MTTGEEAVPEPAPESIPSAWPDGNTCRIGDLLVFDGLKFVENLYWTILQRAPDVRELSTCLHQLLVDEKPKRDMVLSVSSSEEARRVGLVLVDPPEVPAASPMDLLPPIDPAVRRYHVNELLELTGEQFIPFVYRCLFKKDPDEQAFRSIQDVVESGACGRKDVVAILAVSPEVRKTGIAVDGIRQERMVLRLLRMPLIGAAVRFLAALVRIDQLDRRLRAIQRNL